MSRADRFDRADFDVRYTERIPGESVSFPTAQEPDSSVERATQSARSQSVIWPIAHGYLKRVGESVLADRNGQGRAHKGIDLFADAGTPVLAARGGQVIRVVDGRQSDREALRRAGLFVDIRDADALVYRYLHLGKSQVRPGASIKQGTVLGTVAAAHTSGLSDVPHLHFEVRQGDYDRRKKDYGTPVDPLRVLPPFRS